MSSEPDAADFISVLIPAFNEERHIDRALTSVGAAFAAVGETDYEVIVCDNNSSDATAARASAAGATVVFEAHNQIARARNSAAGAACGEWLIFLDADSELSVNLLEATLSCIRGGTTGAGGALVAFDREDLGLHVIFGLRFWNTLSRMAKWAAGSYIFCRRDAWEGTGGFSEEWYAGEEIAFSKALKRWCGARELRFSIITDAHVRTSARKIDNYTVGQLVRLLVLLSLPGALKSRERCGYWYNRGR